MDTPTAGPHGGGLLIGDISRLTGLTPRAIRHYHDVGLLPEPSRDTSGYRRYGTAELIALVRIARLRALGMPVAQIAERIGHGNRGDLSDSLRVLAGELSEEIERLARLRDRLEHAIAADGLDDPADTLARVLREHGRLGPDETLASQEVQSAELLDALHPGGVAGVIDAAHELLTDPARAASLDSLLRRYRSLQANSSDAEVQALAAEVAAVLPRPENAPPPVDLEAMDALLGGPLNDGQRRFMLLLRTVVASADA